MPHLQEELSPVTLQPGPQASLGEHPEETQKITPSAPIAKGFVDDGSQLLLLSLLLPTPADLEVKEHFIPYQQIRGEGAEGPRALWKGNAVACLRLFPCSAVQLAAYRKFVVLFTDDLGHISQWSSIMAGSLAGMVSTIVTYPTDLIKTRLIVQNMLEPSYRGLLHAFSTIYQQEGFLALYRGVSLTVLGALPFSAGSLLVYMNLEKIWNGPRNRFSLLQNFANVCLAAVVTQTLSFPFDTVKRKMQAQSPYLPHHGGVDVHFSGAMDCFQKIVKTQGVLGLWNGVVKCGIQN
ncbi:PREDICTED: solute carrier family 25 member 43 [Galeopterus variegatus]|uniref:Solute carrier family 25 member 43 n=1 Tax=Galeopterus variegatus TaxID=482537 RepID=A0ABM0QM69_GALVR|nr:PREDICTED: solute carrier family 25 member 43 [Galeopterus variegatus]